MTNFEDTITELMEVLSNYQDEYFQVHRENKYMLKVQSNYHSDKFLFMEPKSIYTSITDFIEYAMFVQDLPEGTQSMRIPFFAGCSPKELGSFLIGENSEIPFSKNIDFEIYPADFNINGLKYFGEYLDGVLEAGPVFESLNNFTLYSEYFLTKFDEHHGRVNLILPVDTLQIQTSKAIEQIFKDAANK